eukprot:5724395-Pleurochrysis_carterae.AAC.1
METGCATGRLGSATGRLAVTHVYLLYGSPRCVRSVDAFSSFGDEKAVVVGSAPAPRLTYRKA